MVVDSDADVPDHLDAVGPAGLGGLDEQLGLGGDRRPGPPLAPVARGVGRAAADARREVVGRRGRGRARRAPLVAREQVVHDQTRRQPVGDLGRQAERDADGRRRARPLEQLVPVEPEGGPGRDAVGELGPEGGEEGVLVGAQRAVLVLAVGRVAARVAPVDVVDAAVEHAAGEPRARAERGGHLDRLQRPVEGEPAGGQLDALGPLERGQRRVEVGARVARAVGDLGRHGERPGAHPHPEERARALGRRRDGARQHERPHRPPRRRGGRGRPSGGRLAGPARSLHVAAHWITRMRPEDRVSPASTV